MFVHLRSNDNNPQPDLIGNCLYQRFPQLKGLGCYLDHRNDRSISERFKFHEKLACLTDIYVTNKLGSYPKDLHDLFQFVSNIKIF